MTEKLKLVVYAAGAVLALLVAFSIRSCANARDFEKRAVSAERFVSDQRKVIHMLNDAQNDLLRRAVKRDTVLVRDSAHVAAVDIAHPPPVECIPNIAVRDTLIDDLNAQVVDLREALAIGVEIQERLVRSLDSATGALASRPRKTLLRLPYLEIEKPAFGPFMGIDYTGKPTAGVGFNIPIRIGAR